MSSIPDDRRLRILVVDDCEAVRESLTALLTERGFEAAGAANGREAFQLLRSGLPDLVLLDLWMPELDGLELLQVIAGAGWQIPVVMLTASEDAATAQRALRLGAKDFLTKPIEPAALHRAIGLHAAPNAGAA